MVKDEINKGKSRVGMGLKEFEEEEIRSIVMGVEVTITQSHIVHLISEYGQLMIRKVEEFVAAILMSIAESSIVGVQKLEVATIETQPPRAYMESAKYDEVILNFVGETFIVRFINCH
ncbi:unnamed protein product [Vicia faba]|uniref:Uncharacterized protein n=1 Tax=Vicia faba TaxID=3906 RepID=A0AAV0YS53_VICFA|nr:unnamed protein product [Vicia faba]